MLEKHFLKVNLMSFTITPPGDGVARAMEKFRRDFSINQFHISSHANSRMVKRSISQKELIEAVLHGTLSRGDSIEDHIGGKYIFKNLCVIVYAPYGDRITLPNVLTVYRDGDEDYNYKVLDLPSKAITLDTLSDDELEAELLERKFKKAEAQRAAQERAHAAQVAKRAELEVKISALQLELENVNKIIQAM